GEGSVRDVGLDGFADPSQPLDLLVGLHSARRDQLFVRRAQLGLSLLHGRGSLPFGAVVALDRFAGLSGEPLAAAGLTRGDDAEQAGLNGGLLVAGCLAKGSLGPVPSCAVCGLGLVGFSAGLTQATLKFLGVDHFNLLAIFTTMLASYLASIKGVREFIEAIWNSLTRGTQLSDRGSHTDALGAEVSPTPVDGPP